VTLEPSTSETRRTPPSHPARHTPTPCPRVKGRASAWVEGSRLDRVANCASVICYRLCVNLARERIWILLDCALALLQGFRVAVAAEALSTRQSMRARSTKYLVFSSTQREQIARARESKGLLRGVQNEWTVVVSRSPMSQCGLMWSFAHDWDRPKKQPVAVQESGIVRCRDYNGRRPRTSTPRSAIALAAR
jgi:hypothetical protein